jgi:hypothetical protein
MNYFIHDGLAEVGPFSYDELKIKNIQPSTPVWREGFADWMEACQLEELRGLFASAPPAYQPKPRAAQNPATNNKLSTTEKTGFNIGKSLGLGGLVLIILLVFLYFRNQSINSYTSSNKPNIPYIDPEKQDPTSFLNAVGTYKPNFWGTKEEISGIISNKATHTNYKDVHLRVDFFSQTKTVVSSQEYIIYQYVPYNTNQAFSLSITKPAAAATLGLGVVSATYY